MANLSIYGNVDATGLNTTVVPSVDISNFVGVNWPVDLVAVLGAPQLLFGNNSIEITGAQPNGNFSIADTGSTNNGIYGVLAQPLQDSSGTPLLNNLITYSFTDSTGTPIPGDDFAAQLAAWNDTGAIFHVLNPFVIPLGAPTDGSVFQTLPPALQVGPSSPQYIYFAYNNLDTNAAANAMNGTTPPTFPIDLCNQGTSQFLNALTFNPDGSIATPGPQSCTFQPAVTTPPVPEPSGAALMVVAIAGFLMARAVRRFA